MWRWISVGLIALLVGGGIFWGIKIAELSNRLDEFESYSATLQSNYDRLQGSMTELQAEYDRLKGEYDKLKVENERQRVLLQEYEKLPEDYYSIRAFPNRPNTYSELCRFLQLEAVLPRDCEPGVFDCGESSAYLEWALENAGFDAYIAVGRIPWYPEPRAGYHVWVIVYTNDEYEVAIESMALTGEYKASQLSTLTAPGIIAWNDPLVFGWRNYYEGYNHLFENIYQAIRYAGTAQEWNWWLGYWGFR
ncbi:MAG: hypothetical protein OEW82_07970 [Dehalococcoidia bacterium]|nr:hypothetical protein [Dehalococcoidia bacterium]